MFFQIDHIAVDYDRRSLSLTENEAPMFTWAVKHTESGEKQSAYHITVTAGDIVVFDSGEVQTNIQRAAYGGQALISGEIYTVTLTV